MPVWASLVWRAQTHDSGQFAELIQEVGLSEGRVELVVCEGEGGTTGALVGFGATVAIGFEVTGG